MYIHIANKYWIETINTVTSLRLSFFWFRSAVKKKILTRSWGEKIHLARWVEVVKSAIVLCSVKPPWPRTKIHRDHHQNDVWYPRKYPISNLMCSIPKNYYFIELKSGTFFKLRNLQVKSRDLSVQCKNPSCRRMYLKSECAVEYCTKKMISFF